MMCKKLTKLLKRIGFSISGALVLAGCAQFSPDRGMDLVAGTVQQEIGKDVVSQRNPEIAAASDAAVRQLLTRPLSADSAVQIALLNNRGLQAAYNELALAEAERVGESLPPNPTIALSRLGGSVEVEIERRIVADILALATLPVRADLATSRFHQAQLRAILQTLRVAAHTRRAYYRAVASRELAAYLNEAQEAAETTTKFAKRLGETGAMNKLDQARELSFYAELSAQLALTRQQSATNREALTRALGLWGSNLDYKLPAALPPLPRKIQSLPDIEVAAISKRIDLQMGRIDLEAMIKAYRLTQAVRFINFLDGGYGNKITKEKATGEKIRERGYEVEFQIPIFDFGEVRVREAEAAYMATVNRLLELAVNIRSEARDAYKTYRSSYDIARHFAREILPLRKIISDESQLRYNGMLIDVFLLLAEARQRVTLTTAAIEAKRNFWLASTNLGTAVIGGGGAVADEASSSAMASAGPSPGAH